MIISENTDYTLRNFMCRWRGWKNNNTHNETRLVTKEDRRQDASPRSCLEAEERRSFEAWNHFQLEYKERKSECPFVFRSFRATASATTLEIIARLLNFFPLCTEGFDYTPSSALRRDRPLAAVKHTTTRLRQKCISRVTSPEIHSFYQFFSFICNLIKSSGRFYAKCGEWFRE